MGYAGYVPAKMPPGKLTPAEAAVQAVKSPESLEIIGKLLYNCAVSPKDLKFRKIKLTNPKVQQHIVDTPGALDALTALGWQKSDTDADELVVISGLYFTMKEVRIVEAAKEKLAKDLKSASTGNLKALAAGTVQA